METLQFTNEVKCIVWDLDNTIWDGTLLENETIQLKPNIKEILVELDSRGILHSIASKNNYSDAVAKLKKFEIDQYFLYPEIHWNSKSESIKKIQKNLNIGLDTIVFIDDQPFERDEVASTNPEVETIDASKYHDILNYKRFNPRFITKDSKRRRLMYLEDMKRGIDEEEYKGPKEEFLVSLNMEFLICEAQQEDLKRAEELTVRTNQLNATGKTYSYDELFNFMNSDKHILLVCELEDKYGSYGKIGLALLENKETHLFLHLLLMSCRVLSRSVGSVLLSYIMNLAKKDNKRLLADFKQTDRNKLMYATYKFSNFKEISNDGKGNITFENDLSIIQKYPSYIKVKHPELMNIG